MFKQKQSKNLRYPDEYQSYVLGYTKLRRATRDAMDLSQETEHFGYSLFPFDLNDRSRDYFRIEFSDTTITNHLTKYFIESHSRYRDRLFGHDDSLAGLLGGISQDLLVSGASFREMVWDDIKIEGKQYRFPIEFDPMRPEITKVSYDQSGLKKCKQQYSLFTHLFASRLGEYREKDIPRIQKFDSNEIFFCKYPFGQKTPTELSIPYLKKIRQFSLFGLNQSRGGAEPENTLLPLEEARYTTFSIEKSKHDLARAKIKTIFHQPVNIDGLNMTQYYDVYTVLRYRKYLNDFRDFLVKEFNEQVFGNIAVLNGFSTAPKLVLKGFLTNAELDTALNAYTSGDLSFENLLDEVIRKQ